MRRIRWVLTAAVLCGSSAWAAGPVSGKQPAPAGADSRIGMDLSGIDHAVKPGDNFYDYANGNWMKTAQIPEDRSSTGTFLTVFEKAENATAELIRNAGKNRPAAGTNTRKIADFYAAYMDEAAIEKRGLSSLKPELANIDAIKSKDDLARVLGSRLRADVDPVNATNFNTENLFGLFVTQGLEDPSRNIAYLLQGGLGMPSRDYYLSNDPAMAAFRAKYQSYIAALLKLAGTPDADAKAKTIFTLETKIAQAQESLVESQDVHKANNLWSMADFAQKAPGLNWAVYFKAAGLNGQKQMDAWQPSAITGLSALVSSEPVEAWKNLLVFHTLDHSAALLPKAYADLNFDFYSHTLQGTPQQQPRWKRAVAATNVDLGDAVGQLYVQHYFPASSKAEVQ
jgi:putative endopeptidase